MLHILLVILKILGIILACLLGLLLLLVLIVLFVPIRYRVDAKKREETIIKMRVSWLARLVFVRVWFINKQLHIKLRIFGFTLWDNLRPKKEKKVKHKKSSKKKSHNPKSESVEPDIKSMEDSPSTVDEIQEDTKEEQKKNIELHKCTKEEESANGDEEDTDPVEEQAEKEAGKLEKFTNKIKDIFHKISKLGTTIKNKIHKVLDLIKKLCEKKNLVSVFLNEEMNKTGIKFALGQLLEVLKYCGPQKIEGELKFGTGDPESTGKLLGAVAFLYGYYGKSVTIEPDFENKVFEAKVMVKGRIRFIRLLIIGIKVIRDKNFKKLVKNARQLKEEL